MSIFIDFSNLGTVHHDFDKVDTAPYLKDHIQHVALIGSMNIKVEFVHPQISPLAAAI